jgi:Ran GTPase-activating protein (RanGAP) involved in mRNA processing and transport
MGGLSTHELNNIKSNSITECWLGFRDLGVADAYELAQALEVNCTLKKLNLNGNNIQDEGLIAVLEALKGKDLMELNLAGNSIGDKGCTAVVEYLKTNRYLKSLCLLGNSITDKGAMELATVLSKDIFLESLYLYMNLIGDSGAIAIADSVKSNMHIDTLWLDHNLISLRGAQTVIQSLAQNNSITALELTVHHDSIIAEDREFIFHKLNENKSLKVERDRVGRELVGFCRRMILLDCPLPHELIYYMITMNIKVFRPQELIKIVRCLLNRDSIGKINNDSCYSGSELVKQCVLYLE